MATASILQRLYSLNISSPDFSLDTSPDFLRDLHDLIQSDREESHLSGLQESDLIRLVDFLDTVRIPPSASLQLTEQVPQALAIIPTADDVSRLCLHKLQAICGHRGVLPSSYFISGNPVNCGEFAIACSELSVVWEGTLDGDNVCIKYPNITAMNRQTMEKVNNSNGTPLPRLLNDTRWYIGVLRGSSHV